MSYKAYPHPVGFGVNDAQVHAGSGMRSFVLKGILDGDSYRACHTNLVGGSIGEPLVPGHAFGSPLAPDLNKILPMPCTPSFTILALAGVGTGELRIRLWGKDIFGQGISETSPVILFTTDTLSDQVIIYMSKVFATIERWDYEYSGISAANHTFFIGFRPCWNRLATTGAEVIQFRGRAHMGLGIPIHPIVFQPGVEALDQYEVVRIQARRLDGAYSSQRFCSLQAVDDSAPVPVGVLGGYQLGDPLINDPVAEESVGWEGGSNNKVRIVQDPTRVVISGDPLVTFQFQATEAAFFTVNPCEYYVEVRPRAGRASEAFVQPRHLPVTPP